MRFFFKHRAARISVVESNVRVRGNGGFPGIVGADDRFAAVEFHGEKQISAPAYAENHGRLRQVSIIRQTENLAGNFVFACTEVIREVKGVIIFFFTGRTAGTERGTSAVDKQLVACFRRDIQQSGVRLSGESEGFPEEIYPVVRKLCGRMGNPCRLEHCNVLLNDNFNCIL